MSILVITLTIAAFLFSAHFVLTWGYGILRAKHRGEPYLSWFGVVDFAGLQVMVMLYTALAIVSFIPHGVPPATDWNMLVRRTILYVMIVLVAGIRDARWIRTQNPRWARPLIRVWERYTRWRFRREANRRAR